MEILHCIKFHFLKWPNVNFKIKFNLRVELTTPSEFFSHIEDHEADKLNVWQGELYLEMHNATYTTQARVNMIIDILIFLKVKMLVCSSNILKFLQYGRKPLSNNLIHVYGLESLV